MLCELTCLYLRWHLTSSGSQTLPLAHFNVFSVWGKERVWGGRCPYCGSTRGWSQVQMELVLVEVVMWRERNMSQLWQFKKIIIKKPGLARHSLCCKEVNYATKGSHVWGIRSQFLNIIISDLIMMFKNWDRFSLVYCKSAPHFHLAHWWRIRC